MTSAAPDANTRIAYALEQDLKKHTELFDPTGTALSGTIGTEAPTFTFGVTLKLKQPLRLSSANPKTGTP